MKTFSVSVLAQTFKNIFWVWCWELIVESSLNIHENIQMLAYFCGLNTTPPWLFYQWYGGDKKISEALIWTTDLKFLKQELPSTLLAWIRGKFIIQFPLQEKLLWPHVGPYWWERNGSNGSLTLLIFSNFKFHGVKKLHMTGVVGEVRAIDVLHRLE